MRVTLFIPCFVDTLFPETGRATVRVLRAAGALADRPLDIVYPSDQTCCGQIHYNSGMRSAAERLMRHMLSVFEGADVIVAPSASCVSMVKDQYPVLAARSGDAILESDVRAMAERTRELSQFLVQDLGVTELGARFPHRVALHATCHSTRFLGLGDEPRALLEQVSGLQLVEHQRADDCCGFGGTFAVKNPDTSGALMEDKLDALTRSGAEYVTAVDDSCLMHLEGGLRRRGSDLRTLHLARILDPGTRT
jgi:L-lactate dehydrogenase complex protein LldE